MKQDKLFNLLCIFLTILVIIVSYLYYQLHQQLIKNINLQGDVNQISINQAKLTDLTTTVPTLNSKVQDWKKTIPSSEREVAQFAALLEQFANDQKLNIDIHFEDFPATTKISEVDMSTLALTVILEGSFQGVTQFIHSISNSSYFFKIDKLSLTNLLIRPGVKATVNGLLIVNFNKQ